MHYRSFYSSLSGSYQISPPKKIMLHQTADNHSPGLEYRFLSGSQDRHSEFSLHCESIIILMCFPYLYQCWNIHTNVFLKLTSLITRLMGSRETAAVTHMQLQVYLASCSAGTWLGIQYDHWEQGHQTGSGRTPRVWKISTGWGKFLPSFRCPCSWCLELN